MFTLKTAPAKTFAAAISAVAALSATAVVHQRIDWTYYEQSDGTIALGGANGSCAIPTTTAGHITIPSVINGKDVTAIGRYAFQNCRSLTSITIPMSVTRLEEGAFFGCTSVTNVFLSDSVSFIGDMAFSECWSLTNAQGFVIQKDILFGYWGNKTTLTIPSNVKSLSGYALYKKYNITEITIPNGVTNIGKYAFSECSKLKSVSIPTSILTFGERVFSNCEALESISLPNTLTEIADCFFSACKSLKSLKLPAKLKSIGASAFSSCTSLATIDFPNGLTNISRYAFSNCASLQSILIPPSVTTIGEHAFERCSKMASVRFLGEAPIMGESIFTEPPENAQVTLPAELESWAGIETPWYGMKVIAAKPDGGPYQQIIDKTTWTFTVSNGIASVYSGRFATPAIPNTTAGDIAIPAKLGNCDVGSIGDRAFYYCSKLTSVIIPDGVISIGESAFEGCTSLRTASLPPSMIALSNYAFYNCSNLQTVAFEDDILLIGNYAFCGCTSLASITFNGNEPAVGNYAFYSCPNTAKVFIPQNAMGWAAAGNLWNNMQLNYLNKEATPTYVNSIPEFTAFTPNASIKITPVARALFTQDDANALLDKVVFIPNDVSQEIRFFKKKATIDLTGAVVISAELDLEALEFKKTSKQVIEQILSAENGPVTISLNSAKAGFWYGIISSTTLDGLSAATTADVAERATANGVSLTIPKPQEGTAFLKVLIASQKIAAIGDN